MSDEPSTASASQAKHRMMFACVVGLLALVVFLGLLFRAEVSPPSSDHLQLAERAASAAPSGGRPVAADSVDREKVAAVANGDLRPSTLTVSVLFDDDVPAAGIEVLLRKEGEAQRLESRSRTADDEGVATFADLTPGDYKVWTNQSMEFLSEFRPIAPNSIVHWTVRMSTKCLVRGRVVDASGGPVAGAEIITAPLGMVDQDASTATFSRQDGTFMLRSGLNPLFIGARAYPFSASRMQYLRSRNSGNFELTIVLEEPGGAVEGTVRGASGTPLANALVRVGEGRLDSVAGRGDSAAPLPAQVRSNAQGRFRAVGVPAGPTKITVRAVGHAPQTKECTLPGSSTVVHDFDLVRGANVRGTVRNTAGMAVAGAEVWYGVPGDLAHSKATTDEKGHYELVGLPIGECLVECGHPGEGSGSGTTTGISGEWAELNLKLDAGRVVEGSVVAEDTAVVGVAVHAALIGGDRVWGATQYTDEGGSFRFVSVGEGEVVLQAKHASIEDAQRIVGRAERGPITWKVTAREMPTAVVEGALQDPAGKPVVGAALTLQRKALGPPGSGMLTDLSDATGHFRLQGVPDGEYFLQVRSEGHAPLIVDPLHVESHQVVDLGAILVTDGLTLEVRVASGLDRVNGPAVVILSDKDMRFLESKMVTPAAGMHFRLLPGRYWLELRAPSVGNVFVPVDIAADTQVQLPVDRGLPVTFRFAGMDRMETLKEGLLVISDDRGASVRRIIQCGPGCSDRFETTLRPGTHNVSFALAEAGQKIAVQSGGGALTFDLPVR